MKKTTKIVAAFAAATLAFGVAPVAIAANSTKACLALDTGGVDDKSFNASSWAGAQAAAKANKAITVEYLPAASSADYKVNIKKFVDNKCDVIIGVGFAIGSAIVESAKANPSIKYAVVDGDGLDHGADGSVYPGSKVANVKALTYATNQSSFLAGYLSAGVSKTGKVATYGGAPYPTVTIFMDGFAQGVAYYNKVKGKSVQVLGWDTAKQTGEFNFNVDPDALVEDLPVGIQQRVEIIRALIYDAQVLILDEPTAVLTPQETDELLKNLKRLRESGRSIVFISHKLREVKEIADKITIIRRGKVVGTASPSASQEELASLMVGREVDLKVDKQEQKLGAAIVEVKNFSQLDHYGRPIVDSVSFEVRAGEILAMAGVQGNGQSELAESILGLKDVTRGSITVGGHNVLSSTVLENLESGIAYIPEDREKDGLISSFSIAENLILDIHKNKPFSSGGIYFPAAVAANADKRVAEFDVRTQSIYDTASSLSGGNKQKVVIARELSRPVKLVIACQPTRGLDVGSIEFVHKRLVEERDQGRAVMVFSTELDEVFALADRIAIMFKGQIIAIVPATESRENIGLYDEVREGCLVALRYDVASVCCKPADVAFCADILRGSDVHVGTVVGFPHGNSATSVKVFETKQVVADGATEIDVVMNIGWMKSGMYEEVREELAAVVAAANGFQVKVILENAYLTKDEIVKACQLVEASGADYVKTSTGFAPTGAILEDVKLMRASVSPKMEVKSAGGVKNLDMLLAFMDAGVKRSGASAAAAMLDEFKERFGA